MKYKKAYENKFKVTLAESDFANRLGIMGVLNQYQRAFVVNGTKYGLGYEAMTARDKFWVVSRLKFVFARRIMQGEDISFYSWMVEPSASYTFERDFAIFDKSGKTQLVAGTSKNCIVNIKTRNMERLESISDIMPQKMETKRSGHIEYDKIVWNNDNFSLKYKRKVMFNDLDLNKHCNNLKYSEMAVNCISKEKMNRDIKSYEIGFLKECFFGDEICVYTNENENQTEIVGKVNDGIVFNAKIIFFEK